MQTAQSAPIPRYDHVLVVVMENHGLTQIVGNSQAPYITSLSTQGANFTNSHGVTHPSEPNYIALFSGSTQGVSNDNCPFTFTTNNLGAQLIGAGLSFTGYSESMPSAGYTGCTSGSYARKHNPWVNFSNVPASANQPYTSFPTNFASLPTVAVLVPNLISDMHDGTVSQGDTWLRNNIDAYAQWAKTHNSLLILTFDEDDSSTSANLVPTIFVGANVVAGNYSELINHYNVLTTLESMYGLAALNAATPINDAFTTSGTPLCNASIINGAATTCTAAGLPGYTGTAYTHVYSTYTGGGACTQALAPGYDTSGCTISSNVLTNDVPVTGIALAAGAGSLYTFAVPAGASNLTLKTSGGTGDSDLYVQLGSNATTSSYLKKSDGSTTAESIAIASPAAGTYSVLVQAYAATSGVSLVASYTTTSSNVLSNGVPVSAISVAKSASAIYTMVVPAGRPSLSFKSSGGSGDVDMYVKLGSAPTTTSFLKSSAGNTTAEAVTIAAPAAGTYYVMLYGYAATSGVTLVGNN